ncbi:MbtH family protein [Dactylosporangium fulvum]|uniref:MbtH family protein n=2 Tax=Dactylosporangium fulvum TaxID=53359 RepID=A0ABY5WDN3_9ACTN|nr:MbtH family protein [Dactylosporangium fulvum]UWP87559.1 MbtH family protein [Dactylosporangium fulvum]
MMEEDDTRRYTVVVNDEEQYSIWPEGRDIPAGWRDAGFSGPKEECLAHVNEVWTDMRPLSLRRQLEAQTA